MLRHFLLAFIVLLCGSIISCGKTDAEKTENAILSANIALGAGRCQDAIDTLEANGRQNRDAHYLKVLSSAYACRAGFSVVTFFTSDLDLTTAPPPLGGTTLYSTSLVPVVSPLQNDTNFTDLQKAIDILLYAGDIPSSVEPSTSERAKYFTVDEAADINSQLLFMMFAQLGKYMHHYGTATAAGKKGVGKCFTGYINANGLVPAVTAVIAALPALCRPPLEGSHAELISTMVAATRKTRLCHGVVLFNGILNILPSIIASASGNLAASAAAFKLAASGASAALLLADPTIGVVSSTVNQSICEDNSNVPVTKIETYFALIYESILLP